MAKKTINGLPVFEARMTSENCGVLRVSFVDAPAVETDFVAYAEQERKRMYEITDEDKQRVFGCVLRADYPIYRKDDENGEYYIVFRADEIRAFAQKYLAEGKQNNVDLDHDGTDIEGAEMVQYFIKDTAKGIAPEGFEDVADGSLFAEYQITDADLWEQIKSGEFHGFSVEIIHAVLPAEYNQIKANMRKSVMAKVKESLAKAVAEVEAGMETENEYKAVSTDKGAIHWDGDEDLKAGDSVWGENEDGERVDLEDGDYKTEDNKVIVVADGKVSEIKDAEAEVAPQADAEGKDEKKEAFAAKVAKYSASYDEKRKKIAAALLEKIGLADFWLYEAGDDFAVIEYWTESDCAYRRYSVAWEGEEAVITDDGVEGHIGFIPNEAPAAAEPAPTENEDEMARVKSDYEAQIAAKDAEIADLKAKLEAPAGESAHDAYKATKKGLYAGANPIEEAMAFLK